MRAANFVYFNNLRNKQNKHNKLNTNTHTQKFRRHTNTIILILYCAFILQFDETFCIANFLRAAEAVKLGVIKDNLAAPMIGCLNMT